MKDLVHLSVVRSIYRNRHFECSYIYWLLHSCLVEGVAVGPDNGGLSVFSCMIMMPALLLYGHALHQMHNRCIAVCTPSCSPWRHSSSSNWMRPSLLSNRQTLSLRTNGELSTDLMSRVLYRAWLCVLIRGEKILATMRKFWLCYGLLQVHNSPACM